MPVEQRARRIAIGGVCECVALTKRTAHRPELTRLNLGLDADRDHGDAETAGDLD
jgi:hypothetical protein